MMRKILTGAIILLIFASTAQAGKWQTLTFGENLSASIAELKQYCLLHDMTIDDVLWANRMESEDIEAGKLIYLPGNKAEMLLVWQDRSSIKTEIPAKFSTVKLSMKPAPKKEAQAKPAAKSPDLAAVVKEQEAKPKIKADTSHKATVANNPETPAWMKILDNTAKADPAKAIASASKQKPDKILADAKKKDDAKNTIPGLMDPVIILSPNGDASNGPMRLVITGNKVEVVRLPQSAAPKKPTVADLNNTLGAVPGYVPYYNMTPLKPRNDNNIFLPNLNGKMLWPLDGKVSSYFGMRGKRKHEGIDICMPAGTPIRAAKNGVVSRTGNNSTIGFRGYGNFVMLDHGAGLQTFYAHCLKVAVVPGQRVMQGQIIAYVGSTGRSTGNHLHFEVRLNNTKVNPMPYLGGNTHYASHK